MKNKNINTFGDVLKSIAGKWVTLNEDEKPVLASVLAGSKSAEYNMEIRVYDPNADGHSISWDEMMEQIKSEDSKKNFRNWFNKILPNGFGGYNSHYVLTHPQKFFEECFYQVKWAWQRVFRGWDDRASFSMCGYLAKRISGLTKDLASYVEGYPCILYDANTKYIDENYNISEEDEKMYQNKWIQILKDIAAGFDAYTDTNGRWNEENKELLEQYELGFDLFRKYFDNLWD